MGARYAITARSARARNQFPAFCCGVLAIKHVAAQCLLNPGAWQLDSAVLPRSLRRALGAAAFRLASDRLAYAAAWAWAAGTNGSARNPDLLALAAAASRLHFRAGLTPPRQCARC